MACFFILCKSPCINISVKIISLPKNCFKYFRSILNLVYFQNIKNKYNICSYNTTLYVQWGVLLGNNISEFWWWNLNFSKYTQQNGLNFLKLALVLLGIRSDVWCLSADCHILHLTIHLLTDNVFCFNSHCRICQVTMWCLMTTCSVYKYHMNMLFN